MITTESRAREQSSAVGAVAGAVSTMAADLKATFDDPNVSDEFRKVFRNEINFSKENPTSGFADSFDLKGTQAGCDVTLLDVRMGDNKNPARFGGLRTRLRAPLPMFEVENGEPFLAKCDTIVMQAECKLESDATTTTPEAPATFTMEAPPTWTYSQEDTQRKVVVTEEGNRIEYVQADGTSARINVWDPYRKTWKYPPGGLPEEDVEAREQDEQKTIEAAKDGGYFYDSMNASAGPGPDLDALLADHAPSDEVAPTGAEAAAAADLPAYANFDVDYATGEEPPPLVQFQGYINSRMRDNITGSLLANQLLPFFEGTTTLAWAFGAGFAALTGVATYFVVKFLVKKVLPPDSSMPSSRLKKILSWTQYLLPGVTAVAAFVTVLWALPVCGTVGATGTGLLAVFRAVNTKGIGPGTAALATALWKYGTEIVFKIPVVIGLAMSTILLTFTGGVAWAPEKVKGIVDSVLGASSAQKHYDAFKKALGEEDSIEILRREAAKLHAAEADFFTQDPETKRSVNLFSALVESFVEGDRKGVDRARLLYLLLKKWGLAANVEPAWQKSAYLVTPKLLDMYKELKPSDPTRQVALVYLGLMLSRFSDVMLTKVVESSSWADVVGSGDTVVRDHLLKFREGGAIAEREAEGIYLEYRKTLLYGEREDWFFKAPTDLLAEVEPTLRRKLDYLNFNKEPLPKKTVTMTLDTLTCEVKFSTRSVRATVTATAFTGTEAAKNPPATALDGSAVTEKNGDYMAESTSELLRPQADGERSADVVLLQAAALQVQNALLTLIAVFQRDDYYFSIDRFVVDDAAKAKAEAAKKKAEAEAAANAGVDVFLEMGESVLAPVVPGPDLDALLADHATAMRRVRDLLEDD